MLVGQKVLDEFQKKYCKVCKHLADCYANNFRYQQTSYQISAVAGVAAEYLYKAYGHPPYEKAVEGDQAFIATCDAFKSA